MGDLVERFETTLARPARAGACILNLCSRTLTLTPPMLTVPLLDLGQLAHRFFHSIRGRARRATAVSE